MFIRLERWIQGLPWWGQGFAWPLYGVLAAIAWGLQEMGVRAKNGAKKALAPLLWPLAAAALLLFLIASVGEDAMLQIFGSLLSLIIVVGGAFLGLRIVWHSTFPQKKPHRRRRRRP